MKSVLWLLLGCVVGAILAGWYCSWAIELAATRGPKLSALEDFHFYDKLNDNGTGYLHATGTWRGDELADKVNTVYIWCDASETTCELYQATMLRSGSLISLAMHNNTFRVTKLDAQSVVAELSRPTSTVPFERCARQTMTFDRVAKAVTFVRTKIAPKTDPACQLTQDEPVTMFLGKPFSCELRTCWQTLP
jgi:hypothetical protein